MVEKNDTESWVLGDRWLIIIVLIIAGVTIWNSRSSLFPPPEGYARFSDYGMSFLYPEDLNLWQVAVDDDLNVVLDDSRQISEDWGCVGWNSGNVDFERPGREGYFQEFNVIWLAMNPPSEHEKVTDLFFTALEANFRVRNREYNMTRGSTGFLNLRDHNVKHEFFNYTYLGAGEDDPVIVYGIVGVFYCERSGRAVTLYYIDIFDFDPVYDEEMIFSTFKFYLDSIRCH
jgi:hypothetical protein